MRPVLVSTTSEDDAASSLLKGLAMASGSRNLEARPGTGTRSTTTLQKVTTAVGAVFLLVGIAGFIPGLTTHYDQMTFAGPNSMAMLIGVFMVSILHNIVHLLFGLVGLAAARSWSASRAYLFAGGVVYLVLWLYGLVIDQTSSANFVPLNSADNGLHLVLGLGMIALAVLLSRRPHLRALP